MDIIKELTACLRFEEPEITESEIGKVVRKALEEIKRLRLASSV